MNNLHEVIAAWRKAETPEQQTDCADEFLLCLHEEADYSDLFHVLDALSAKGYVSTSGEHK